MDKKVTLREIKTMIDLADGLGEYLYDYSNEMLFGLSKALRCIADNTLLDTSFPDENNVMLIYIADRNKFYKIGDPDGVFTAQDVSDRITVTDATERKNNTLSICMVKENTVNFDLPNNVHKNSTKLMYIFANILDIISTYKVSYTRRGLDMFAKSYITSKYLKIFTN